MWVMAVIAAFALGYTLGRKDQTRPIQGGYQPKASRDRGNVLAPPPLPPGAPPLPPPSRN